MLMKLIGRTTSFAESASVAWAPLPLRAIVGFGFMHHGYAKIARGPDAFAHILAALGMPHAELLSCVTIIAELLGGAAILLGAFVLVVSLPMVLILLTAIFSVHVGNGFSSIKLVAVTAAGPQFGQPGYETDLLYIACLGALLLIGPGRWSVDTYLRRRLLARV